MWRRLATVNGMSEAMTPEFGREINVATAERMEVT